VIEITPSTAFAGLNKRLMDFRKTDLCPDDLTYGIVYAMPLCFAPLKTPFKVYHDEQIRPRDQGGNGPTVIHVTWE
jgi:hypothetical protein